MCVDTIRYAFIPYTTLVVYNSMRYTTYKCVGMRYTTYTHVRIRYTTYVEMRYSTVKYSNRSHQISSSRIVRIRYQVLEEGA
jgi:hypothetical protein